MRHIRQPELYSVDYNVLRQRFLSAARRSNAALFEYKHPLHGPGGEHLFTDVAYLGERNASKKLVILSGTHGVEGQFGSACQAEWLAANNPLPLPPRYGCGDDPSDQPMGNSMEPTGQRGQCRSQPKLR
ncbi:DUF2817 domain-containing protein [Agrobacterium tumefaciens]|uniref:DUF2817 domain-containing protein n=1 Tax=Agrobacterium tumefaciens TaxID=358 RepID=UPI003BA26189